MVIKLKLSSIFVEDQNKALKFYTEILGFEKKVDVPVGEHAWLTVGHKKSEFELLLEPNKHSAQHAGKGIAGELLSLVGIKNLRASITTQGALQGVYAEGLLHRH